MTQSPARPDPVAAQRGAESIARASLPWLAGPIGDGWSVTRGDVLCWDTDRAEWFADLVIVNWIRKDGG